MAGDKHSALYQLLVDFDLDRYTTPYVPRNFVGRIPQPVRHFLGYRRQPSKEPPALVIWTCLFIATVGGLCVVSATYVYAPGVQKLHPPVIVASMGASAVLNYNTIKSPLGQPRNTIIGHTLSAIMGVAICKLFQLSSNFNDITWVSGAVGCAFASLVMSMTGTVHPPGGATAVLASTEASIVAMGWWFVPIVTIATCEMMGVALLLNNIVRHYPAYWWTPNDCGYKLPGANISNKERSDEASAAEKQSSSETEDEEAARRGSEHSEETLGKKLSNRLDLLPGSKEIHISAYTMAMPPHIRLTDEETEFLKKLQQRI